MKYCNKGNNDAVFRSTDPKIKIATAVLQEIKQHASPASCSIASCMRKSHQEVRTLHQSCLHWSKTEIQEL